MKKNIIKLCLLLFALIGFTCCSSNDDGDQDNELNGAEYYITGKVNGEPFQLAVDIDALESDFLLGTSYQGSNDASVNMCETSYSPGIEPGFDTSLPAASIIFEQLYNGGCDPRDETSVFNSLFQTGSDNYVQNDVRGINIEYTPNYSGDVVYSSRFGAQTGSTFNISATESRNTRELGDLFRFSQMVTGTFSCKVYNRLDPTDELTITDGKFRLLVDALNLSFMN